MTLVTTKVKHIFAGSKETCYLPSQHPILCGGSMRVKKQALAAVIVFIACGGESEVRTAIQSDSSVDTLTLSVVDTIGALSGENAFVFGDVSDVSYSASGDIFVLDRMNSVVSLFSPEGEFITSIGGSGDAPWEFSWATSFAPMYDGRLIVSDYAGRKLVVFNDTLGYSSCVTGYARLAPAMLKPLPDGTVIGRHTELLQDDDGALTGENSIRRWNANSTESISSYLASPMYVTQLDDGIDVKPAAIISSTSPDGSVYCTVASDSLFQIFRYSTEGLLTLEIEEPWNRIAKTDEEIEAEGSVTAMETDEDGNSRPVRIEVDVDPYHNAVEGLSTDHEGRLWVRIGSEQIPTFRIYSHSGEFLFTATCPELEEFGRQIRFQTRHGGIVAWDTSPEDYPKVYLLQTSEI